MNSIGEVLAESDVVSLHTPSTPETKSMFNAALFSRMKPKALFVNCARGDLVVEKDLYDALKQGVIGGAAIDVFETEPTSKDNPLFTLDNIVVMPHCASYSGEALVLMALHAAQGIDAVLSGKEPEWPVNHLRK